MTPLTREGRYSGFAYAKFHARLRRGQTPNHANRHPGPFVNEMRLSPMVPVSMRIIIVKT
jgi:hypothetical protein